MKKKILMALALIGCAVVLVAGTIAGTVAYLTAKTETVTNTFTVGKVGITLTGTSTNNTKLIPGEKYDNPHTITVDNGSEECYLFVKIVDNIAGIQGADTIVTQLDANGWTQIDVENNIWAHERTSVGNDVVTVFSYYKIDGSVVNSVLNGYDGKTIAVTAYAVQAAGFANATAAWGETFGAPANP